MSSYSNLPTWPLILFGIIEPLLLAQGFAQSILDPDGFSTGQAPNASAIITSLNATSLGLTYQLGNLLFFCGLIQLICTWTQHPEMSRKYLSAAVIGDIGHIYAVYAGMGSAAFFDVANWTGGTWANVAITAFLGVNRILTVTGAFGELGAGEKMKLK